MISNVMSDGLKTLMKPDQERSMQFDENTFSDRSAEFAKTDNTKVFE